MKENVGAIEIKFIGRNVHPGTIRARDLARVLTALDDAFDSMAAALSPDMTKESFAVSLVRIRKGSAAFALSSTDPALADQALQQIADSIRNHTIDRLPEKAKGGLKKVVEFNRDYACRTELRHKRTDTEPVAVIPFPGPMLETPQAVYSGNTTIYARILGIMGEDVPTVKLMLPSGRTVKATANRSNAKALGKKLYEEVGLSGKATWFTATDGMKSFDIEEITPYESADIAEVFHRLRDEFGRCFDNIQDVEQHVAEQRED